MDIEERSVRGVSFSERDEVTGHHAGYRRERLPEVGGPIQGKWRWLIGVGLVGDPQVARLRGIRRQRDLYGVLHARDRGEARPGGATVGARIDVSLLVVIEGASL